MALTQAQKTAVFTNIETVYTVNSVAYVATKTYRRQWKGELTDPIIALSYPSRTVLKQGAVGRTEWDTDLLTVDVYALTDNANGVHGGTIVDEITRVLLLWFKTSADAALVDNKIKVSRAGPDKELDELERDIYRRSFDVKLLYKLI